MAGRGSAPGERRGGNEKGSIHKHTVVKKLAVEALASPAGKAAVRDAFAKVTIGDLKPVPRGERAIDTLAKIERLFMGLAAKYQSRPDPETGKETNPLADETKFSLYLGQAMRTAASLAPYQNPTFKAVAVQDIPPPATKPGDDAKVVDSMTKRTQQDAGDVYARLVRGGR